MENKSNIFNSGNSLNQESNKNFSSFKKTNYKKNFKRSTSKFKSEMEEKIVATKRISKTTKGGRQSRIWILVIVGNRKGKVGVGAGKSKEFPDAMKKAVKNALKNCQKVKINKKGSLYHEIIGNFGASKVLLKPAKVGTGIIAGGIIKIILELSGYSDIYSKNLGSNTSMNVAKATIKALSSQFTPNEISDFREKTIKEIFN